MGFALLCIPSAFIPNVHAKDSLTAAAIVLQAPTQTQVLLKPGSKPYLALEGLLASGNLLPQHLAKIVKNPLFTSRIISVLPRLQRIQEVPGADRLLKNLSKSNTSRRVRGFSFELRIASRLGNRVKELSADVRGYEVDAVLRDGTLVEMKMLDKSKDIAYTMLKKATQQLQLRGEGGERMMLVTDRALSSRETGVVRKGLGERVRIFEAKRIVESTRRSHRKLPALSFKTLAKQKRKTRVAPRSGKVLPKSRAPKALKQVRAR